MPTRQLCGRWPPWQSGGPGRVATLATEGHRRNAYPRKALGCARSNRSPSSARPPPLLPSPLLSVSSLSTIRPPSVWPPSLSVWSPLSSVSPHPTGTPSNLPSPLLRCEYFTILLELLLYLCKLALPLSVTSAAQLLVSRLSFSTQHHQFHVSTAGIQRTRGRREGEVCLLACTSILSRLPNDSGKPSRANFCRRCNSQPSPSTAPSLGYMQCAVWRTNATKPSSVGLNYDPPSVLLFSTARSARPTSKSL